MWTPHFGNASIPIVDANSFRGIISTPVPGVTFSFSLVALQQGLPISVEKAQQCVPHQPVVGYFSWFIPAQELKDKLGALGIYDLKHLLLGMSVLSSEADTTSQNPDQT